jgi:crotonobetaine/carnitine-CoA ligase
VPIGEVDPESLFAWASQRLEPNMVPSFLHIVPAIPKTASEKPQERFLVEMFHSGDAIIHTIQGERV